MPFFIKSKRGNTTGSRFSKGGSKRKISQNKDPGAKRRTKLDDEEIESDSDIGSDAEYKKRKDEYESSEDEETVEEKKLRLAKQYLAQIEAEEAEKREDEEEDFNRDIISHRLKQDILEQTGRLQREVADNYLVPTVEDITVLRGHQLSVTCVVISPDSRHLFTGSKDCSIIKWDIQRRKKVAVIPGGRKGTEKSHVGHTEHILCLAISSDGKYLASGGLNKLVRIWNPDDCTHVHFFPGHKDAISSLAFRKGTHQLFSASHDRSVKVWNVEDRTYIETLFGHEDSITCVDSLSRDRAITGGGRDGSVRIWKVVEESQLVFHGHKGSIDCVALINESNFVSGADDNSISLWVVTKKKPLVMVRNAHGRPDTDVNENRHNPVTSSENWITALTSLQHTDLIASGSKDGCIRLWKAGQDMKSLTPLFTVPVNGFVNSLKFSKDGDMLVAGIGQEHRLGRWWRIKEARNGAVVIKLKQKTSN
ncbi:U3 small nucleolar RNA-interacting protein 2-like isoform X2 [Mizuhopecten yessoensis]|uniref:U3 small nucleolar RNA-interacting protein 2 n=1 Tax=Mizuhopecten yessoensis TaxID=6573 RepID=A0A210Q162_MIZYE|nr:U3 small nucleolar RNA-interacting protein 2-like isoform X2 [Mizuhopecten yessoensis]OWF42493.1 U3 small nucleolar RNA-interacting protein 2 [Mizuhopecten yessoensis]